MKGPDGRPYSRYTLRGKQWHRTYTSNLNWSEYSKRFDSMTTQNNDHWGTIAGTGTPERGKCYVFWGKRTLDSWSVQFESTQDVNKIVIYAVYTYSLINIVGGVGIRIFLSIGYLFMIAVILASLRTDGVRDMDADAIFFGIFAIPFSFAALPLLFSAVHEKPRESLCARLFEAAFELVPVIDPI